MSLNTRQSQLLNSPITQALFMFICHRLQVPVQDHCFLTSSTCSYVVAYK